MFLVCLFGMNVSTGTGILGILAIALVSTLLVTAVPIGGGTISEMLIITMKNNLQNIEEKILGLYSSSIIWFKI